MSFTYVLSSPIGRVRLLIGDTIIGAGVLPGKLNLQDEELQVLIDRETTEDAAAAGACELLSRTWAKMPSSLATGPISQSLNQSKQFAEAALAFRKRVSGNGFASVKTIPPNRIPPVEYP